MKTFNNNVTPSIEHWKLQQNLLFITCKLICFICQRHYLFFYYKFYVFHCLLVNFFKYKAQSCRWSFPIFEDFNQINLLLVNRVTPNFCLKALSSEIEVLFKCLKCIPVYFIDCQIIFIFANIPFIFRRENRRFDTKKWALNP